MADKPEMTNVFQFMEIRAPYSPESKALRQNYIRDDMIVASDKPFHMDTDLQSDQSRSAIGRLVYKQVFCADDEGSFEEKLNTLIGEMSKPTWKLLVPFKPPCADDIVVIDPPVKSLQITELERRAYFIEEGLYYLLPEKLEQIPGFEWLTKIKRALQAMERTRQAFDLPALEAKLKSIFDAKSLREVVFSKGAYTEEFSWAKRILFDTLYLLYVLRRRVSVNLEHVIEGLQVLHVLEALAVDELVNLIKKGPIAQPEDKLLRATLDELFPELKDWNGKDPLPTLPLLQKKGDFEAYFTSTPVVHPIFARLFFYKRPFNDLKVVKQWLVGYVPGEISHIENVLKGESKDRTHRRLEKTEETFSFSSSTKEESQKDSQTTDRLELKREVETIVKTELNVGANVSLTYDNKPITATVSGNFSYKRDATNQTKTAEGFSREVLAKALERVEHNTAESRSVTKIFEMEEINKHGFDNKAGKDHVRGTYRWLDKKYKAQLFNFGKRMMFEFVIPEPAAFFVESRLRAFQATLDCPQPPKKPVLKIANLKELAGIEKADDIDEGTFKRLRQQYNLSEFSYPQPQNVFLADETNKISFSEKEIPDSTLFPLTIRSKLGLKKYKITLAELGGSLIYHLHNNAKEDENTPQEYANRLELELEGKVVGYYPMHAYGGWHFDNKQNHERMFDLQNSPVLMNSDWVTAIVRLHSIREIKNLTVRLEISPSADYLIEWRLEVFNTIKEIEQQKLNKEYQEAELVYKAELATYRNRKDELKAVTINSLLQGQSEAFNRGIIRTELKKHCLTMLAKEFDSESSDDLLGAMEPMERVKDGFIYHTSKLDEDLDAAQTTFSIELAKEPPKAGEQEGEYPSAEYPSIVLEEAKKKGRYIQFLEQAFEWQQLAYIFYPYFWATRPKWIEMMNRSDDADPNMSAFLQAGSVRVLIAVTPGYDDAVLHFLATREPWDGGPSPVIGDPLFIPLHQELRRQQDDLYNAVAEGEPWTFTLPTSLIYLEDMGAPFPPAFPDVPQ